jgi:hypothetical protein
MPLDKSCRAWDTNLMTFTKTEQQLLAEAQRSSSKLVGVDFGSQGPSGRRRSFGDRRLNAAVSLMKKGFFVRVDSSEGGTPLYSKTGYGVNGYIYSSTWKLVEQKGDAGVL